MSTSYIDILPVRQEVTDRFVSEFLHNKPEKQERIIRLLLARMPRSWIDAIYIAQNLYAEVEDSSPNQ